MSLTLKQTQSSPYPEGALIELLNLQNYLKYNLLLCTEQNNILIKLNSQNKMLFGTGKPQGEYTTFKM